MLTPSLFILLLLLGAALLLVLLALLRRLNRRTPLVKRSVVYLVSGQQLLVMQQAHKAGLRSRLEVPKGKAMNGENALDAAYRECFEESGLRPNDLQFLTSFQTRQRNGKQRGIETWDAFWGRVPAGTILPFTHRVIGKGRDRGRVYHFRLLPLETAGLYPPLDLPLPTLQQVLSEAKEG